MSGRLAFVLAVTVLTACGPKPSDGPAVGVSTKAGHALPKTDQPTAYLFDSLDDRAVSSDAFYGKPTLIAFVTTGDIVGQAQVGYLVRMAKNDGDRVNYALVALHPRKEIVLVDTYRRTLGVEFPVALADGAGAAGPFGEIPAVPTIVVLDRGGRIAWKHTGLAKSEELRDHLRGL